MNSNIKKLLFQIKKRVKKLLLNEQYKIKGHELIKKHEKKIIKSLSKGTSVIEVGSERKAGSTKYLAKLSKKYNCKFYTVDIATDTSSAAEKIVKKINPEFKAINQAGEEFFKSFEKKISLVYLDAFDIPGDWLKNDIYQAYKERGQTLTLENCWKMHYDCAVSIVEKLDVGGYVCFDDVNPVDTEGNLIFTKVNEDHKKWSGKGETAIPYLIENGFKLIDNKRASALFKKVNY